MIIFGIKLLESLVNNSMSKVLTKREEKTVVEDRRKKLVKLQYSKLFNILRVYTLNISKYFGSWNAAMIGNFFPDIF